MSGRKNNLKLFQIITAGSMASTNVLTSTVTCIQWLDNASIQLNWTGSPTGTFAVQVSADYGQDFESPPNVTNTGNWVSIPLSYLVAGVITTAITIPTSVGSPVFIDLNQLSAPWIRVLYTNASGTGTLSAYISAKML